MIRKVLDGNIRSAKNFIISETLNYSNYFRVKNNYFCNLCKQNSSFLFVDNINSPNSVKWIKDLNPDIIFCFGWSSLIKKEVLNIAPTGVVGYHPTKLPKNRGRHPLIWALALGLKESASTFFFMDDGVDSGDIVSQYPIKISENDNAGTLYKRITETALEQIEEFLPTLQSGDCKKIKQDHSISNTWRKRGKDDGKIDWRMSAYSIYNLVRGLTKPYIGAHFLYHGQEIKVWKAAMVKNIPINIEPGKIFDIKRGKTIVKCGEQAIQLEQTEPEFDPLCGEYL